VSSARPRGRADPRRHRAGRPGQPGDCIGVPGRRAAGQVLGDLQGRCAGLGQPLAGLAVQGPAHAAGQVLVDGITDQLMPEPQPCAVVFQDAGPDRLGQHHRQVDGGAAGDGGCPALDTGLRMTVMSGGMLAAATIAGRASAHVPVRLLIGAGLITGGLGLLLMRGLGAASSWTHLIPGLILAGVGAGLVNPPLASTAVGVMRPERAGMASGINSTFRQVGIATGIAVLGTLFSHTLTGQVRATITTVPGMSGRAAQVAGAVQSGQTGRLIAHLPARTGQAVAILTRSVFTAGLNQILLVAAIIAFASGLVSLAAIRGQDFVAQGPGPPGR